MSVKAPPKCWDVSWKANLVESLILFVFGGVFMGLLMCPECYKEVGFGVAVTIFSGAYWVFLWKGNAFLADVIDVYFSWLKEPLKRFWVAVVSTTVYTALVVLFLNSLFYGIYLGNDLWETFERNPSGTFFMPLAITFFIATFMHGRGFLYAWRQSAVDVERLRSEQLSSRYESLKKQVNPHFLFNSLNTLSSLVHKDASLSEKFIKQLSEVYRYVLESQDREVVDLKDELIFSESFVFLLQIRHGNGLKVIFEIPENERTRQVPPMVLQMLIENAVKHNIISEGKPLEILVNVEGEYLIVKNNLQKRKTDDNRSAGLGINNIKLRYEYLSGKPVRIDEKENQFVAQIPLLTFA